MWKIKTSYKGKQLIFTVASEFPGAFSCESWFPQCPESF